MGWRLHGLRREYGTGLGGTVLPRVLLNSLIRLCSRHRLRSLRLSRWHGPIGLHGLLELVIRVASGEQTKAEKHGFREISIFKDGVVL